jgi:hypothetical protein
VYGFLGLVLLVHSILVGVSRLITTCGLLSSMFLVAAAYFVLHALFVRFELNRAYFMVCIQIYLSLAHSTSPSIILITQQPCMRVELVSRGRARPSDRTS